MHGLLLSMFFSTSVFLPLVFILTVNQAFSSSMNTSTGWKETISPRLYSLQVMAACVSLIIVKSCKKW